MSERPDHLDALEQEGLAWVDRMLSGEATTADLENMKIWRALSPRHAAALAQAARVRRAVAAAAPQFAARALAEPAPGRAGRAGSPAISRRALIGGGLAASFAGYIAINPPMGLWPSMSELFADYHTHIGERRRVDIRDGVALDLNTQTSVALSNGLAGKQARLIDGEALATVDVAADRAFVLAAANGQVTAHQASFDVRRDGADVSVTCASGEAHVACGGRTMAIGAGQRIDYGPHGLGKVAVAQTDVDTAWRSGLIIFHDKPLSAVIDDVNRYRVGKIMVVDQALGREKMSGSLHLDRLDEIVAQVRLNGARVTALPGGVVLLG